MTRGEKEYHRTMNRSALELLLIITCTAINVLVIGQNCPALPGLQGRDGRDGRDGKDGRDGRDGKDCTLTQLTQPKGLSFTNPADSCSDVIKENSLSSDGWYWVRDTSGGNLPPRLMMCYLRGHDKCGDGVWMRIGYFDTRQSHAIAGCPDPLMRLVVGGNSYCLRQTTKGCDSMFFATFGGNYSEVCGMIMAKQYGHINAFWNAPSNATADDTYAEGILITRGSPRQHVWTYVVADVANPPVEYTQADMCPCTGHASAPQPPSFVGNDYYCDSGNDGDGIAISSQLYNKTLWNSEGPICSASATCCENPDQPWFKKKLDAPVGDNIEFRWCGNQGSEGTPTERVELYIRVD